MSDAFGRSLSLAGAMNLTEFTVIATRPRKGGNLAWTEHADAPMTLKQAHDLVDIGRLILASRHYPDRVECVVKSTSGVPTYRVF